MFLPECLQLIFQLQLAPQLEEQAVVPLFGREVLTDRRQIKGSDSDSFFTKASGGAVHEGGLAHLARGEDVAKLAALEGSVDILIRLALDVGGRVGAQRPARDVEIGLAGAHPAKTAP